ncbi:MAG: TIM barrel protein [Clostridiales bacterium]|nr:TIM barrel protein [Clostridiales bacterium]
MHSIGIGTCVPGPLFADWAPALKGRGFECFSINFHMEFRGVDLAELAKKVRELLDGSGVAVSSLGYYCNALMYDDHKKSLERCIDLARSFGTGTVSTFAGALEGESVEAAMPKFKAVFGELARRAGDSGVRLAIENCPMGGTWKSNTCNIGFHPRAWEMMFDAVDSDALGLEWEPAHQMAQLIDPVAQLRRIAPKVVHIHGKDANIKADQIAAEGIIGPAEPVDMRFPGLGDTDWRQIFAILHAADYRGYVSIEGYHDPFFQRDWEMTGQVHALNYLKWCRGGDFIPNPWPAIAGM